MKITCIGSGSSGNAFYVEGRKGTGIYLDAGISPKIIQRMGLPLANVPVFVTHEHGDHGGYAKRLQDDYGCPVHCSLGTAEALKIDNAHISADLIDYDHPVTLSNRKGVTEVRSFPVIHNAEDPVGFYIQLDGERLIYLADSGMPPYLWGLDLRPHVMILESNYTRKRLIQQAKKSEARLFVAGRVSSGMGHLSANDTYEFAKPYYEKAELIVLFHLSKNNFDRNEFYQDDDIPDDYKKKVVFAKSGMEWNTLPF